MKKKITILIFIFTILFDAITFITVRAKTVLTDGDYTCHVENEQVTIVDFNSDVSGEITVPSELGGYPVVFIRVNAFMKCTRLTAITIPDGVVSIGDGAFKYCSNLTSVSIPESVNYIENWAFLYCGRLTDILIDENNAGYSSVDGNLFNKDKSRLIQYAVGKNEASYLIPDGVNTIADEAFLNCNSLSAITIPDSVTAIGYGAFEDCQNLLTINIPDGVSSIKNAVFRYCYNLKTVVIPESVTSIGNYAFESCPDLTTVTVPESVTSIGSGAFKGCIGLTEIILPDSLTSIGDNAFIYCKNLNKVYYQGSEEQWDAITVYGGNDALINADIIFNSTGDENGEHITSFGSNVSKWAVSEIESAYKKGLVPESMIGFDFTEKITRGEFAAIAIRLYETLIDSFAELPKDCPFDDINGDINEESVKKAYAAQIVAGISDSLYKPSDAINREQLATMLCRVIKKYRIEGWTLDNDFKYHYSPDVTFIFSDDADISDWAKSSVYYMAMHGIVQGVGDNRFAPKKTAEQEHMADYASATKEQAILMSLRMYDKLKNTDTDWQEYLYYESEEENE